MCIRDRDVYIRGLIEFTNFCKNDCLYCGIRRSNARACRYRLSEEEILLCAEAGYRMGFRTVVLQGGEDPWFTDERLCRIVRADVYKRQVSSSLTYGSTVTVVAYDDTWAQISNGAQLGFTQRSNLTPGIVSVATPTPTPTPCLLYTSRCV